MGVKRTLIFAGNPKRIRVLCLTGLGVVAFAAWSVVLLNEPGTRARWIAFAGAAVACAMTTVLLRSVITRRGIATAVLVLSIVSLVLGMIAMVMLTF
jgi:hypothetical protein